MGDDDGNDLENVREFGKSGDRLARLCSEYAVLVC